MAADDIFPVDVARQSASREAETKEMFPIDVALRPAFREAETALGDVLGLTSAQRKARTDEYVSLVRETGIDPHTLAPVIYNAHVEAQVAAARGAGDVDVQALNENTRRAVREAYGGERAEKLLDEVRTFVRQHPRLQSILQARGIGSRPEIVMGLIDHVRRLKSGAI